MGERLPEVHLDQLPVWPVADVAKNTANTHHRYKNWHIVSGFIPPHVGMQLCTTNVITRQYKYIQNVEIFLYLRGKEAQK